MARAGTARPGRIPQERAGADGGKTCESPEHGSRRKAVAARHRGLRQMPAIRFVGSDPLALVASPQMLELGRREGAAGDDHHAVFLERERMPDGAGQVLEVRRPIVAVLVGASGEPVELAQDLVLLALEIGNIGGHPLMPGQGRIDHALLRGDVPFQLVLQVGKKLGAAVGAGARGAQHLAAELLDIPVVRHHHLPQFHGSPPHAEPISMNGWNGPLFRRR